MARVEAVPERKVRTSGRFAYWLSGRRFGEVAEPLTVMAHHPKLLLGYGLFELTAASAFENYRTWFFNRAFGMKAQGFSEGTFCAVAETLVASTTGGEWR